MRDVTTGSEFLPTHCHADTAMDSALVWIAERGQDNKGDEPGSSLDEEALVKWHAR